jgi:hypothetical protein
MKVYENRVGLELNGTQQLLIYSDDVHLLGDNIDTINKNTETSTDTSKVVSLEIKTKYTLLSHHQDAGQNHDIKIVKRTFEYVAQLKYLGERVINKNMIQEEIKRRLISDIVCYNLSPEPFVPSFVI